MKQFEMISIIKFNEKLGGMGRGATQDGWLSADAQINHEQMSTTQHVA